jgi:glucose/arabinose dehydrogenase
MTESDVRSFNPEDILLPYGYEIEVFWKDLMTPINLIITRSGEMLVADAGVLTGNGKVGKLTSSGYQVIAEGFNPPLTGICEYQGDIFVSHRGAITVIKPNGEKKDIISGLPSWGDHHNNRVVFGPDEKMYFGQGTATNSGVVGEDNRWLEKYPFFHDYPGANIELRGQNFRTRNLLSSSSDNYTFTGAFSPYGMPSYPGETVKGSVRASGSILRANPDGSELELVAWGLRNPFRIKFDRYNRLFVANHGIDERGSRPIANSPDEFHMITPGMWYGWPDYTGGYPVTLPMFKPEGKPQPEFLLLRHPSKPPKPFASFAPHSATMGFDFNENPHFAPIGDVFIAEFGSEAPTTTGGRPSPKVGHRVSRIDMRTGDVTPFAINKTGVAATATGGSGFERPIDVVFGQNGDMYIVDFGVFPPKEGPSASGVIWRVVRK